MSLDHSQVSVHLSVGFVTHRSEFLDGICLGRSEYKGEHECTCG
jgi:hypothetical protein